MSTFRVVQKHRSHLKMIPVRSLIFLDLVSQFSGAVNIKKTERT